jgi:histidinol phosphatase-like PHP family hydrolase
MAEAAIERGYEYVAITDHTKRLKIAGGIDEDQLLKQGEEISRVNDQVRDKGLTVLRSAELYINPRGEGIWIASLYGDSMSCWAVSILHWSRRRSDSTLSSSVAKSERSHIGTSSRPCL